MARAKMCVDFDQKSFVLGTRENWHKLTVLSTGHLAYQIIPNAVPNNRIEYAMSSLTTENIAKLHKQFGHCKTEKMIGLLKTAGHDERSLRKCVEIVTDSSEVCIRYGRVKCKPKVSVPMSSDFNRTVCVDLHCPKRLHHRGISILLTHSRALVSVVQYMTRNPKPSLDFC